MGELQKRGVAPLFFIWSLGGYELELCFHWEIRRWFDHEFIGMAIRWMIVVLIWWYCISIG